MTNNEVVEKLFKKKRELIKIINSFGIYGFDADDLLQEFFIKILHIKEINNYLIEEELSMNLSFIILKNMSFDFYNHNSSLRNNYFEINEIELNEVENEKVNFILKEIENLDIKNIREYYTKKVLELYIFGDDGKKFTLRSLGEATGIKYIQLYRTINNFRNKVVKKWNKKR